MKKSIITLSFTVALSVIALSTSSCKKTITEKNPFDITTTGENIVRNKIVVISDLHLGADHTYSECVEHLSRLTQFLNEVRESETVKELVIAGDLLDEWYVPSRIDTYGGKSQKEFIRKIGEQNKEVIDVLKTIIKEKKVKLTYTPGNHDLLVTEDCVADILPNINQARDTAKLGLGTYHPDDYPQIAIEHGHRYDFFCSPDPYSNQNIATGSILPPGYFFTRIAVNSFLDPASPQEITKVRDVTLNSSEPTQITNFIYYSMWKNILTNIIPVKDNFDEKIIKTNIGKLTQDYCINDIVPYNAKNGSIEMNLFNGNCDQKAWEKRLAFNNVPIMTKVNEALQGSHDTKFLDNQSDTQFFQNKNSKVRVVIFGHTHIPMIKSFTNLTGQECIYANSGTWVEKKVRGNVKVDQDLENMDFIVITPQVTDRNTLKIERLKYSKGKHLSIENKSVKL